MPPIIITIITYSSEGRKGYGKAGCCNREDHSPVLARCQPEFESGPDLISNRANKPNIWNTCAIPASSQILRCSLVLSKEIASFEVKALVPGSMKTLVPVHHLVNSEGVLSFNGQMQNGISCLRFDFVPAFVNVLCSPVAIYILPCLFKLSFHTGINNWRLLCNYERWMPMLLFSV